jgi:predicted AlkP superfamily pyrophosphatase or phosphodiesterase
MPGSRGRQLGVAAALLVILVGVYLTAYIERPVQPSRSKPGSRSNGTHAWESTVLLISLDGLKPDYLDSGYLPTLLDLAEGRWPIGLHHLSSVLHAESMIPVSPSLTFPNHWVRLAPE